MNLKQQIMQNLTKDICEYLRLDENLFFCGGHINYRTCEGRKYFCYIAINDFGIPANFVKNFLGYADIRTVNVHYKNLRGWLYKFPHSQIGFDIKAIKEKCKDYLSVAA